MKITRIEKFPLNLKPVKIGYRKEDDLSTIAMVNTIIIRVNTDKDISGLGEAATIRSYFNQTMGTMQDWLVAYEQVLIGEDPRDIIKIHRKMDLVSGEKAPGCHPTRAAIDMAMYDIIGKTYNCPVYEILGGAYRTEFEMLTNLYEDSAEEKAQAAREYVQKGFRGLKVKVGDSIIMSGFSTENFKKEKNKLIAALEAVPSDIYIDADITEERVLKELGVKNFDAAIVSIATDLEASILVTMMLKEMGLKYIIAKAQNNLHAKILKKIGVDKVVFPERDMGARIARRLITPNIKDYVELEPNYNIMEIKALPEFVDKSLSELDLRNKYGINVLAIKRNNGFNISPRAKDVIKKDDLLIVIGETKIITELAGKANH